jgi:hypothetical protein
LLPAPGLFSTTNCWPSFSLKRCASTRAVMSAVAPGPKPMMIFTARDG